MFHICSWERGGLRAVEGGEVSMATDDVPPPDEEVVAAIEGVEGGISPGALLDTLIAKGHTRANTVVAIQRVFDRGLVILTDGAKLVVSGATTRAAA